MSCSKKLVLKALLLFAFTKTYAQPPDITAHSAILVDAKTGEVLFEKNAKNPLPIASLTKIMTALLLLENGDLNDEVTVSKKASSIKPAFLNLRPGEKIKVSDLVQAILIRSANDASVAAAEYLAGSEEKFVVQMNEKAKEIGAKNTCFLNSHGLDTEGHYSTASDLAKIASYAMKNHKFAQIVRRKTAIISWNYGKRQDRLTNKNKLLWKFPYADGIKTGYTKKAGKCLVASATKEDWKIIAVLLHSQDLWTDAMNLLKYGFDNFKPFYVVRKNEVVKLSQVKWGKVSKVGLVAADDLYFLLTKAEKPQYTLEFQNIHLRAPLKYHQKAGKLKAHLGKASETIQTDLLTDCSVELSKLALFLYFVKFVSLSLLSLFILVKLGKTLHKKRHHLV